MTRQSCSSSGGGADGGQCKKKESATAPSNSGYAAALRDLDPTTLRHIGVLTASQFVVNAGFAAVVPVLPLFAAQLGLGATGVGAILALPSASRLALNLHCGAAADRVGRKPLMVLGAVLTAASQFGTAAATTLWAIVPCRFLVGAGTATSSAGSSAMLADLTDPVPRYRAMVSTPPAAPPAWRTHHPLSTPARSRSWACSRALSVSPWW